MPDVFKLDEKLWEASSNNPDSHISRWCFSGGLFFIGDRKFPLNPVDNHLSSFELALFDLHFTYWLDRAKSSEGFNHNFRYHAHLRSTIESHFQPPKNGQLFSSPKILIPWLWRTFCLCPHVPAGRTKFSNMANLRRINIHDNGKGINTPNLASESRNTFVL
jgi:hypothetical protein